MSQFNYGALNSNLGNNSPLSIPLKWGKLYLEICTIYRSLISRAVGDGLSHSTNALTQKVYLVVLDVFGSHAAPANAGRDDKYAAMLATLGQ